jgi:hypothetical protein
MTLFRLIILLICAGYTLALARAWREQRNAAKIAPNEPGSPNHAFRGVKKPLRAFWTAKSGLVAKLTHRNRKRKGTLAKLNPKILY